MTLELASAGFTKRFGHDPEVVVRAPGRVNLMGDHTDYCGGLVLPIAINCALYVASRRLSQPIIRAYSSNLDRFAEFHLDADGTPPSDTWARYIWGVATVLGGHGASLSGAELWIGGDLPVGSGLSSSAALEVGCAIALLHMSGHDIERKDLASLCQKAENDYAGSPCGIMDQTCCLLAQRGSALLIDCESLDTTQIALDLEGATFVVVDTGTYHSIAGGEYTLRRNQCEEALSDIRRHYPAVISLSGLQLDDLDGIGADLDSVHLKRLRHVVSENSRVTDGAKCLSAGNLESFGSLMRESHESLRDDFEVSCGELDEVFRVASSTDGVYGARMTGGGFGGCVVALASCEGVDRLGRAMARLDGESCGRNVRMFEVTASEGARVLWGL